jgi:hypothetical protein
MQDRRGAIRAMSTQVGCFRLGFDGCVCSGSHDDPQAEIGQISTLYSRKRNPKNGRRRNLGTFATRAAAEKHERAVQYFKRH